MDGTENPVLEPRSERIARYKAERRRELAERYGNAEELPPSKWVRRDGKEAHELATQAHRGVLGSVDGVNGRTPGFTNGMEADTCAEPDDLRSQGCQDKPLGDAPQLHTRVSVGQLRSALLQQRGSGAEPEKARSDAGPAASSLDLAVEPLSEGARRRTRRYLPPGQVGGRKTGERFRTQPITAYEMQESSGLLDAAEEEQREADVKTDERAKMSVAAKMTLFKELEKSAAPEAPASLKPRSGSFCHDRRARRGNEHRFLTQPITCEEMVSVSAPKTEPPAASQAESSENGDESCKLSMSEKLALFNKLSLPGRQDEGLAEGPPERRRQKGSRYRTQPITVDEVNLLQTGPVLLPAFCLSSHLSDRQQASSVNLKPSEVRLSRPGPDESSPNLKGPQHYASDPGLRGILKKSRSEGAEGGQTEPSLGQEQNGGGCDDASMEGRLDEMQQVTAPPRRHRAAGGEPPSAPAAPWRQRARNRKESSASTAARTSPGQEAPLGEVSCSVETSSDSSGRLQQQDEQEVATPASGHVQVTLVEESPELQEPADTSSSSSSSSKEQGGAGPQRWEPVFASVYSNSTPQYIMCFNQTNQSFEAQEVSSPTRNQVQPQWRQKDEDDELPQDRDQDLEDGLGEEAPVRESVTSERSPSSACPHPPGGDVAATESEQDLDVLCQSNTHILTSAVAEHRRSVRPSRRTQGSRNPLRALAAREDIMQDYMGERVHEREDGAQAEKKSKNSPAPAAHPGGSKGLGSSSDARPPFSDLMLIHIKGRQRVQVRLVEPSARSLNSGDCFLLVTPERCILWVGEFANEQERTKASELASFIQSQGDLGCQASQVVRLEEGLNSDDSVAADFWTLLGGRTQYKGAGAPEEDELYERGVVESNCVYRLVENRLVPHEQAWASVPSMSLLSSTEALVFDFGSEVYLWHGRDVGAGSRDVALQLTHQVWAGPYDYSNCRVNPLDPTQRGGSVQPRGEGRPSWALFGVLSEPNETTLFTEKFLDWPRSVGGSQEAAAVQNQTPETSLCSVSPQSVPAPSPPSSDLLSSCDAKALVSGRPLEGDALVLGGIDVQRGYGVVALETGVRAELETLSVDTWHVHEFDDSEVPVASTGQLHEGDSYVVRWTYSVSRAENTEGSSGGRTENTALFLWRGRHSSASGRDTAAFLSIGMKDHEESQVVVSQGREPPCFLQLFQGGLVIHKGKREEASPDAAEWRLFCVRGELPEEGSLLEVECCCAGLRSRGCAVLLNSRRGVLYLWSGCKAHSSVREVSKRAAERLTQTCPPELGLSTDSSVTVQVVEEGSEPSDFWRALGTMDRKAYDCMLQDPGKYTFTPRLFHLSACSGSFQARELQSPCRLPGLVMAMPFVQESLYAVPQPALFLLDNRLEVYLWQRGQPEQTESSAAAWSRWHNERRCAMQTAVQYCKEMNPRRPPQAYLVLEGCEPLTFTNVFPHWDTSLGPHTQSDTGRVKLTLVQDALAQLMKTQYPLEELLQNPLPEGVDPQHLEVYLSDQDFQTILEMKRDEYASLPSSKQIDVKKSKGLLH